MICHECLTQSQKIEIVGGYDVASQCQPLTPTDKPSRMAQSLENCLVVAISSRALFDFEEENLLFEAGNDTAYMELQRQRLDVSAKPGVALTLVRKLLAFNTEKKRRVEVVILSRNDPISGLRVFRSAQAHGLSGIQRGVFTQGREPFRYLRPLGAHLFLSANAQDVQEALALGYPAARVVTHSRQSNTQHPNEVRIAFDGDAVLFSDEAEQIYQKNGLSAFQAHETEKANIPLPAGPFKPFLQALQNLQNADDTEMHLRTALVTARSAPAHERAIHTLMSWNIAVHEAMFLGGLQKGPFLREFEPDFFFDDQTGHVTNAADHVPSGHVSSGVRNPSSASVQAS